MVEKNPNRQSDAQLARELITEARRIKPIGQRIKLISSRFLDRPYIVNPLIGSPSVPEQLVVRLDGFDCVTYVETVLAMACSSTAGDYLARLREIRYEFGEVDWRKRLHYITTWANYHVRRGFLRDMTHGEDTVLKEKVLNLLPGLGPRRARFRYFPKSEFPLVSRWLIDGDLIYLVSTRRNLDAYHIGFIIREGEKLIIRHAREMRGRVLEEPAGVFVRSIRSPGFMINRPVDAIP